MMQRRHPLSNRSAWVSRDARLKLHPLADEARFSLRIDSRNLADASRVFGLALPEKLGGLARSEDRIALCLGPDDYYLLAPLAEQARLEQGFAQLYPSIAHSLVDVGHREIGIGVEGSQAAFALQAILAFDVETMPTMSGCRTLLDKTQILLLHETEHRFRIEVWHSFADHVWGLLRHICHEVELGV